MPHCVNCDKKLVCTCEKPQQPIGQTIIDCPQLAKGRLWIHVIDDVGVNIPGVPVSGGSERSTDSTGMAKFEQLDPNPYKAAMKPSKANLDAYDVPKDVPLSRQVQVKAGILAYVMFELRRKAKLKVRFVLKSGANLATESLLDTVGIPVTAAYTGDGAQPKEVSKSSDKGLANFEVVSAGKYKLTPTFTSLAKEDYEYVEDPKEIDLLPGDDQEIVFEVKRKTKLTVKFLLKACGPKFQDDLPFKTTAIPVTAEPKANGSKDSKPTTEDQAVLRLLPASYTVKPDFSVLDDKLFEWKSEPKDTDVVDDDDKPLIFELGRKARLKVEIVYKHDRDHHLRDAEDGVVPIKLEFLGNDFKPASTLPEVNTKEGVAEFASLSPGKYKITPDFEKLKKCKFDYTLETREVEIFPDVDEPVIFDVEPLYQEVHFIGHTLFSIPTQVYVLHPEDDVKLEVKTVDEKRTFTYKTVTLPGPPYSRSDFPNSVLEGKASFSVIKGVTKLDLKKKWTEKGQPPWTIEELHADLRDTSKLEIDPVTKVVTFKNKPGDTVTCCRDDLQGRWKARYHGYLDDFDDIAHRVKFVADTLEKAHAQAEKHPTVLKVFMIPECFFQGLYGAYLEEGTSALVKHLEELVAPVKWKDWVFSFGTVNSVFEPVSPNEDIKYRPELYEMRNHAPVIRGGLGVEGSGRASTRLIPKLLNSAELAEELVVPAPPNLKRPQAVNAKVQFTGTKDDNEVGTLLLQLLQEEKNSAEPGKKLIGAGLPAEWWPQLVKALYALLSDWGLARVVNNIRASNNAGIDAQELKEWRCVKCVGVNKDSSILPVKDAALVALRKEWKKQFPNSPPQDFKFKDDARASVLEAVIADATTSYQDWGLILPYQKACVQESLRTLRTEFEELSRQVELNEPDVKLEKLEYAEVVRSKESKMLEQLRQRLEYLPGRKDELTKELETHRKNLQDPAFTDQVARDDAEGRIKSGEAELEELKEPDKVKKGLELAIENLKPTDVKLQALKKLEELRALAPIGEATDLNLSIFPLWKKLLTLYIGNRTMPMSLDDKKLDLDAYCFAGPRKVGPWYESLNETKGKDACKIMVFGVEICADHAANRLEKINVGDKAVGIDIQLVPSAGMAPKYFAARKNGYIFNCDGWNRAPTFTPKSEPGKTAKPEEYGRTLTVHFDGPSPFGMMDAEGKPYMFSPGSPHTALSKRTSDSTSIESGLSPTPHEVSADLAKGIFESGEGELHVYAKQDLPK